MRPLRGSSRMDVGCDTSPTLASVVCKTSLPAGDFYSLRDGTNPQGDIHVQFLAHLQPQDCFAVAKPDASNFSS